MLSSAHPAIKLNRLPSLTKAPFILIGRWNCESAELKSLKMCLPAKRAKFFTDSQKATSPSTTVAVVRQPKKRADQANLSLLNHEAASRREYVQSIDNKVPDGSPQFSFRYLCQPSFQRGTLAEKIRENDRDSFWKRWNTIRTISHCVIL